MRRSPQRKSSLLRKVMGFLGVATALVVPGTSYSSSTADYNIMPYNNDFCAPPCCVLPGQVMHEMFFGTGLTPYPDGFHKRFYIDNLFTDKLEPALKDMSDEFRNMAIYSAVAIGAFLDGQTAEFAQATLQKVNAETMTSYQVSDQICRFGTLSRSLVNSDSKSRAVQLGLMEAIQNRQTLKQNMGSGYAAEEGTTIGRSSDKQGRLKQLQKKFCDNPDLNDAFNGTMSSGSGLTVMCQVTADAQLNRDIDMTRTLAVPNTLEIDFPTSAATLSKDEENVMALGNYLYGHDLGMNLGKSDLASLATSAKDGQIKKLMDFRSIVAKRSVAANSFAKLAALKAQGGAGTKTYLEAVAKELGLTATKDIDAVVGPAPSYYAQMEFLTKKLYQSPNFYANLYDSPINVERQQTAMKAIELMQDRDIYESMQRYEMLLSTLLELQVQRQQDDYFNKGTK